MRERGRREYRIAVVPVSIAREREELQACADAFDPTQPHEALYADPFPADCAMRSLRPVQHAADGNERARAAARTEARPRNPAA